MPRKWYYSKDTIKTKNSLSNDEKLLLAHLCGKKQNLVQHPWLYLPIVHQIPKRPYFPIMCFIKLKISMVLESLRTLKFQFLSII